MTDGLTEDDQSPNGGFFSPNGRFNPPITACFPILCNSYLLIGNQTVIYRLLNLSKRKAKYSKAETMYLLYF